MLSKYRPIINGLSGLSVINSPSRFIVYPTINLNRNINTIPTTGELFFWAGCVPVLIGMGPPLLIYLDMSLQRRKIERVLNHSIKKMPTHSSATHDTIYEYFITSNEYKSLNKSDKKMFTKELFNDLIKNKINSN